MPKATNKKPKTVLDKVAASIVAIGAARDADPSGGAGSFEQLDGVTVYTVSRQAIAKYAKENYDLKNPAAFKKALKAGVASGKLHQCKQSFGVVGYMPAAPKAEDLVGITDKKVGDGEEATSGSTCTMKYKGTLDDGTKFDSASKFTFTIDAGEVIMAWDQGVKGMKVGGRRNLVCPPKFAYGKRGSPPDIPPNAVLHFDITLLAVQ